MNINLLNYLMYVNHDYRDDERLPPCERGASDRVEGAAGKKMTHESNLTPVPSDNYSLKWCRTNRLPFTFFISFSQPSWTSSRWKKRKTSRDKLNIGAVV